MPITLKQLQENIDALEAQGAPREDVQGYIDTLQVNSQGMYEPKAPAKPKSMGDIYKSTLGKGVDMLKSGVKGYAEAVPAGLAKGAIRSVGTLAGAVGKGLDYTVGQMPKLVQPGYKSDFGESMKQMAELPVKGIEAIERKVGLNPESTASKVGQFVGGAIATAPVGEGMLAGAGKVLSPLAKPITKLVKSDDIIANILQPSAGQAKIFPKAKEGFKYVLKYAPPSVQKKLANVKNFKQLESVFDDTANTIYKQKVLPVLEKSTSRIKNANIDDALRGLQEAYTSVVGDEARTVQKTIEGLIKLNKGKGLSAKEITQLKTLHTNANQIFTQKGIEKTGFNVDQLDDVRGALKTLTEKLVKKDLGVDISKANARYGALQSVKNLLREQAQGAISTAGRGTTPGRVGAAVEKITELPGVQQAIDVADVLVKKSPLKMLRSGKINPAEVEKQLPQFMKRLIEQIQKETTVKGVVKEQGKIRKGAKYLTSGVINTINKSIQQ